MNFLELALAAEQRLFGPAKKEKKEDFTFLREAEATKAHASPTCEESEVSEERSSVQSKSRYAYPWPDAIEGLGHRHIEAFSLCDNCGTGTWAFYGAWALCLRCANRGRP